MLLVVGCERTTSPTDFDRGEVGYINISKFLIVPDRPAWTVPSAVQDIRSEGSTSEQLEPQLQHPPVRRFDHRKNDSSPLRVWDPAFYPENITPLASLSSSADWNTSPARLNRRPAALNSRFHMRSNKCSSWEG